VLLTNPAPSAAPHLLKHPSTPALPAPWSLFQGEYTVGAQGTDTMLNSLMYRASYYDFGKVREGVQDP